MKLNKLIFALLIGAIALSSKCDDDTVDPYAYEDEGERYEKDIDSIENFLSSHFVNDLGDLDPTTYSLDPIPLGGSQTSLINDLRLNHVMGTADADHDGVDQNYKIYYLKLNEGIGQNPTYVDSVYTSYKGSIVTGDNTIFESATLPVWLSLPGLLKPWSLVLPNFKDGTHTTNADGTIDYNDFGAAAFFLPSGMAYYELSTTTIPSYTPIMFQVELKAVNTDVDHDHDGILSIYEDLDNDGSVLNDDTDSDNIPNYLDPNDDGDGHNTIDEGADPNGDGNPADAEDIDNDGIPNFLDSDSY